MNRPEEFEDDDDEFCLDCGELLDEFGLCPICDDDQEDDDGDGS